MAENDEQVISWMAVPAKAPVIASDGTEVGHVLDVAALPAEDIFHGVVFQHHRLGKAVLAPAADIDRITDRAVHLRVDSAAAERYEEFRSMTVKRLGLRGILSWKHLGWTDSPE